MEKMEIESLKRELLKDLIPRLATLSYNIGIAAAPIGTIVPWINGYFDKEGQFKETDIKPDRGWVICDGRKYSHKESKLYPLSEERYLPDLRGRFLMGSDFSMIGQFGGTNNAEHHHITDDKLQLINFKHSHPMPHVHNFKHDHTIPPHTHKWSEVRTGYDPNFKRSNFFLVSTNDNDPGKKNDPMNTITLNRMTSVFRVQKGEDYLATQESGAWVEGTYYTRGNIGADSTNEINKTTGPVSRSHTKESLNKGHNFQHNHQTVKQIEGQDNRPEYFSCVYIMRVF